MLLLTYARRHDWIGIFDDESSSASSVAAALAAIHRCSSITTSAGTGCLDGANNSERTDNTYYIVILGGDSPWKPDKRYPRNISELNKFVFGRHFPSFLRGFHVSTSFLGPNDATATSCQILTFFQVYINLLLNLLNFSNNKKLHKGRLWWIPSISWQAISAQSLERSPRELWDFSHGIVQSRRPWWYCTLEGVAFWCWPGFSWNNQDWRILCTSENLAIFSWKANACSGWRAMRRPQGYSCNTIIRAGESTSSGYVQG